MVSLLESTERILIRPTLYADLPGCLSLIPDWVQLDHACRDKVLAIWQQFLHQPSFHSDVLIDTERPVGQQIVGMGVSMALDRDWQKLLRETPPPFIARRIYRCVLDGSFKLPDDVALGEMNTAGDVAILVVHYTQLNIDMNNAEAVSQIKLAGEGFAATHAGFRLRELFVEGMDEELAYLQSMGFKQRTSRNANRVNPEGSPELPVMLAFSIDDARQQLPGTPARNLFQFSLPTFGFSASERRMLKLLVLLNIADKEIARELSLSTHTIKKLWASIHQRIITVNPNFFGHGIEPHSDAKNQTRGPEKRRLVLTYLKQHAEELRPYTP